MRRFVVLGPMRAWMKWALAGMAVAIIAVGSAFIGAAIDDDKATAAPAANPGVETGLLGTPSPVADPTPAHPQAPAPADAEPQHHSDLPPGHKQ